MTRLTEEEARRINDEGKRRFVESMQRNHPRLIKRAERERRKVQEWRGAQQRKVERGSRRSA